ncbi:MAG TPA: NUDIX hydrolase [Thermoanaerobaculia bacterium]|nr:NUDIX hydrolase [Thermoanaerobaculia bacterium]
MKAIWILSAVVLLAIPVAAQDSTVPKGYWSEAKIAPILAKTETIRLASDPSQLTTHEQAAVRDLLEVGQIFQDVFEESRHHQALRSRERLEALAGRAPQPGRLADLLSLYRLFQGPIATTLDNTREPYLPVDPQVPARNVYPVDADKKEIEAFLASHPEARHLILGERTVVRRATKANLDRDLGVLATYPSIEVQQPGLQRSLKALARAPNQKLFYAVPYSVAYADRMVKSHRLLHHAASLLEESDPEFARYLRNRARDLLSNDYESGDASWVTGRFKKFNAQIGAYETYDDALFGVKAFYGFSLMLANEKATTELRRALGGLQAIEDALPYEPHKRVREDIPVGVYHVIADFGQARGTNTATILPNDALFSKRYGRTILLRENIMKHPELFASDLRVWKAATSEAFASDLVPEGNFQRTLWHEIGHYLGPDRDASGRTLDIALEDYADSVEEMKADLVSLFALHTMHRAGTISNERIRAVQASGIRRTLQAVKPRRDQPYQIMQLIQFNWFVEKGLLASDPVTGRLTVRYERYSDVVASLLKEVLALQVSGDKRVTERFFDRYTSWDDATHEKLAARIREAQGARFRIVRYAAVDR